MDAARILVVGGGIAGVATAWHLARRGVRGVVLVERERDLGLHSTSRNAAILRTGGRDAAIEELALRGAEFLRAPPTGFGKLLDACGILVATAPETSELAPWERRLARRADVERVDAARARALAPQFDCAGLRAWWFPREGVIDIAALLSGFALGARELGVAIETGAHARELVVEHGAVVAARLEDGREIRAERTLIAAGGWAEALARASGSPVRLRPTRRHLLVTLPDERVDPRGPVVWAETEPFYARPAEGGLLLCGCDETDVEPDDLAVLDEARDTALARAGKFLPRLAGLRVARRWSGVRTLTRDGRFVVGPDPALPGLFWAAGLGGHGMTCASAVGELAADRLLDVVRTDAGALACDPARFALSPSRARAGS